MIMERLFLCKKESFVVSHDEYIENAPLYKYCLICNTLKPIECFHKHAVLKSGRQGECIMCKTNYNAIKNGTRTSDQHYLIFSETPSLN